jgi:hypothetical protein
MAHFAELNSENKVVRVLVISNDQEHRGEEYLANDLGLGGKWIQTSYNNKIRGKFAGIGDTYDEEADLFIAAPLPYVRRGYLDQETGEWVWIDPETL